MSDSDQLNQKSPEPGSPSRRQFIKTAAGAGAAFMIVPRHVLGRGFQAPSNLVNVAAVGINGMGGSNLNAVMSQNVVAICDVDLELLDAKLAGWTRAASEAAGGAGRRYAGRTGTTGWFRFGRVGRAPVAGVGHHQESGSRQRAVSSRGFQRKPAEIRFAGLADPEVRRLPRDAREAEGHRRASSSRRRITCTRSIALGGDGSRQARLRAEAAHAGRSHEARHLAQKAKRDRRSSRRWATRATRATRRGTASSTSRPARSATCAKSTSGPTGRSATGRRACRGPAPLKPPTDDAHAGTDQASTTRLAAAMAGNYPVPRQLCVGSVPRRRAGVDYHPVYHPFNWRGWVDWGRARSATWART